LAIWFTARRRGNVNRLFPSWGGCFVSAGADIANDLLALVHKESLFQFCPTLGRAANSVGMSPLGAHFNPAVTLIFAARGATPWRDMLPYIIVQCAGGVAVAPAFTQRSPELRSTMFRGYHCSVDRSDVRRASGKGSV
jgi:hypothetical protein